MESKIEEALTVKAYAEKRFVERDFAGARNYALKAQKLCPELEGIAQMVATFGVYTASEAKVNGEFDFYAILGLNPSADKAKLKKQYRKMAVLLHPDKNKTVGADGAFKLISEAWTILSDSVKRTSYDHRRNYFAAHSTGVSGFDNYSNSSASHQRLDTFWTVCTSCHVQYEYLRKYVNKKLSCKNCRGVFVAVETGVAPVNGSFPYCPWSFENGYGSHGCGVTYIPAASAYCSGNGISAHHSGHGAEYVPNVSFQWTSFAGNSAAVSDANGVNVFTDATHQVNGKANRTKANGKHRMKNIKVDVDSNGCAVYTEHPATKVTRPYKRRKFDLAGNCGSGNSESAKTNAEEGVTNTNGSSKPNSKLLTPADTSLRRCSAAPAFDARQLLIDKARTVIRQKLEEIKLAAQAEKKRKAEAEVDKFVEAPKLGGPGHQSELKKAVSMAITVPDSDFHDFDKDRSEECFKPKQIWALYDEEDGMPRLYCLIREIISVKPFKIHISYLSSKTDSEFGSVNWLDSGFTKSCGNFRAYNAEIVEQVNIFSHLLSKEKAGRGGCIRIYPRSGDIWAVYRNWSSDWNRTTPAEVRHQYEMVEILDDYSEDLGVCVTPLIKLGGFKTVYQRNASKDAIRWIPRREMLRFSHQVPSCLLKDLNLPDGCWDLDPAAIPDELLQGASELQKEDVPTQTEKPIGASNDIYLPESSRQAEENHSITVNYAASLKNGPQMICEVQNEEKSS